MDGVVRALSPLPPHQFVDRRAWDAHQTLQSHRRASLLRAASFSVWDRLRRRRLRSAFGRWRRKEQILTAQCEYKELVYHQKHYTLRKLLLRRYWRSVALAFHQWLCVCRNFVRLQYRIQHWQRKSATCVAFQKWSRLLYTERLEEEVTAGCCVLASQRLERFVQRTARRKDHERLVSCWIQWKTWYRQQRCVAWRRGLSLAMRKHWAAWKRFHFAAQQHRAHVAEVANTIMVSVIDDCIAQCLWRQRLREDHLQTRRLELISTLLVRWSQRTQREQLTGALSLWKRRVFELTERCQDPITSPQPETSPVGQRPRFPARFAAAYRQQQRQQKLTHQPEATRKDCNYRPQWR